MEYSNVIQLIFVSVFSTVHNSTAHMYTLYSLTVYHMFSYSLFLVESSKKAPLLLLTAIHSPLRLSSSINLLMASVTLLTLKTKMNIRVTISNFMGHCTKPNSMCIDEVAQILGDYMLYFLGDLVVFLGD